MMSDVTATSKWDPVRANDLGSAGHLDDLAEFIAACFGTDDRIHIEVDGDANWWISRWEIVASHESRVLVGRNLGGHRRDRLQWRVFDVIPLIAAYHRRGTPCLGHVAVNLEDTGFTPGLAFCDNRPEYFLIPDPFFLSSQGYADVRHAFSAAPVAWEDRARTVFWRGSDFGPKVASWNELPRVRLCQLAKSHDSLFDVGMTEIRHGVFTDEITASGLMRNRVPNYHFNRYRAHIDIDGRSNSWPGLFQKLLSGSPVLKVASPLGYRQWYYDRLVPWVNYVPVSADLSDLPDKAAWVLSHDIEARRIGEAGRTLAEAITYEAASADAMLAFTAAFQAVQS
jgi:hypothetical protein